MSREKDYHYTGYNSKYLEQTRELRRNMTPQERKLWHCFLKEYPVRFYRQRSIDRFIADFYCSDAKLVIELDGSQHYTPDGRQYDAARTQQLKLYGLDVLRFSNEDIERRFSTVCREIDWRVKQRTGAMQSQTMEEI